MAVPRLVVVRDALQASAVDVAPLQPLGTLHPVLPGTSPTGGAPGTKRGPPWGPDRLATRRVSSVSMGSTAGWLGTSPVTGNEDEESVDILCSKNVVVL